MTTPHERIVRRTAELARLDVTTEEIERLGPQFARILAAFEDLAAVDPGEGTAMRHAGSGAPRTRPDRVGDSLPREPLLGNAPAAREGFFEVPRALPAAKRSPSGSPEDGPA